MLNYTGVATYVSFGSQILSTTSISINAPQNTILFSVELRTTHWAKLVEWYRDAIGLPLLLKSDENRYALLQAGDSKLTILGRERVADGSQRWSLAFEVNNLPDVLRRMVSLGSRPTEPRVDTEGYAEFTVNDPDGNRVRVFQWVDE